MSSDPLQRVRQAALAREVAEQEYRDAIVAAVRALEPRQGPPNPHPERSPYGAYARVAKVAGISRQSVRELTLRHRK